MTDLKKLVKLSFVFILLLGCYKPIKTFSYSSYALGTNFNVLYNSYDPIANFDKLSDSIFDALNKSMSTYIRESDISKIESDFKHSKTLEFKESLADIIINCIIPINEKALQIMKDQEYLDEIILNGTKKAKSVA